VKGVRDGAEITDPLPPDVTPAVAESTFTAVAVGNLDDDPDLDVWLLNDSGRITHIKNDLPDE